MKTKLLLLLLISSFAVSHSSFAQGSLTPPGAPAPTMKTLQQVEPRTPISSAPFTITNPGSYYLTTNLSVGSGDAIIIATNGVTLDLSGFTISSSSSVASGTAIFLNSGLRNIAILNGFIQGGVSDNGSGGYNWSGFGNGINYTNQLPMNVRVSGISVYACQLMGISIGTIATVAESCTVRMVGGYGINASTIRGCAALECGNHALIGDVVSDSRGQCNGVGYGIAANCAVNCYALSTFDTALSASTAQNCRGVSSANSSIAFGISATTAQNCSGEGFGGAGVSAQMAHDCAGSSSLSTGVEATTAVNCYGHSIAGIGVRCNVSHGVATGCFGQSSFLGVNAYIANCCVGDAPTPISVSFKYNMP